MHSFSYTTILIKINKKDGIFFHMINFAENFTNSFIPGLNPEIWFIHGIIVLWAIPSPICCQPYQGLLAHGPPPYFCNFQFFFEMSLKSMIFFISISHFLCQLQDLYLLASLFSYDLTTNYPPSRSLPTLLWNHTPVIVIPCPEHY